MKRTLALVSVMIVAAGAVATAQQKTLSSTMDIYVFPEEGQDAAMQSKAESECYQWAVNQTGTDPFDLQKQAEQQQQTADQQMAQAEAQKQQAQGAGKGAGAQGAVGGAAAGALVGAIAGDAGKGAAIGATVGLIGGRRRGRQAKGQATAQADAQAEQVEKQAAQAQAATAEQLENFKKAFSVCLEAKSYMVK